MVGCSPFSEELEPALEDLRLELLIKGESDQIDVELSQAAVSLFGGLQQSRGGKIRAGALSDMRREAYLDLVSSTAPFYDWEKIESGGQSPEDEEEERKRFLGDYNHWVNTGSLPVASNLQYRGAPDHK